MSWETVRLGDVAKFVRGVTYKPSDVNSSGVGVMRTKNVQATLDLTDIVRITPAREIKPEKYLQPGDTLISSANSWNLVGKCCYVETLPEQLAIGGFVTALRPGGAVDQQFLYRWFSSAQVQELVRSFGNKTTSISNLNLTRTGALRLPLPPLPEQRRIAAILDQADEIRANRRAQLTHLDELPQSLFHEMFGSADSWAARWPIGIVGDMTESAQYGSSSKSGATGTWPILRMGNLDDHGRIDFSDLKYLDLNESDIPKYTVKRGDVLFNRTNSIDKVGKTAVVRDDRPLAFAGYLVRLRLTPDHEPDYLAAFLNGTYGRALRRNLAKAAVNQANINATQLKNIRIPLPPFPIQQAFAVKVESVRAERDRVARALDADDELFATLQYRAFRGEL